MVKNPLLDERKVTLDIDAEGKKWLDNERYNPVFGARPLKRVIHRELQNLLAEKLLAGEIRVGDSVQVRVSPLGLLIHPVAHDDAAEPERHAAE